MHRTTRTLLIGLQFVFLPTIAQSQWTQTSGPKGWDISSIVSHGSALYASTGTGGCAFVSTDGGYSWSPTRDRLPARREFLLHSLGTTLFVGTESGLFRTTDDGFTWSNRSAGLPSDDGRYWMIDIAHLGNRIFVWSTGIFESTGGVFETVDDGLLWQPTRPGLPSAVDAIPDYTQRRFAAIDTFLFYGYSRGIYRTSVNGSAWISVTGGLPDTVVSEVAAVGNTVLVLAGPKKNGIGKKAYRSSDLGKSWSTAEAGLPDTLSGYLLTAESDLYRWEWKGRRLFRSTDMGASWVLNPDTLDGIWAANGIRYARNSLNDQRLLRSTDHGTTWAPMSEPPIGTSITALAANSHGLAAATFGDQWDYATTDRGAIWSRLGTNRVNLDVNSFAFCGPYLIAGGTSTDGGIDVSTDNGATWMRVTPGSEAQIEALAVDSPYVYASGNGMWVSSDCGLSWKASITGLGDRPPYLGPSAMLNSRVFVAEYWGDSIYFSEDRGTSWKAAGRAGQGTLSIISLLAQGGALFAGTEGQGIWRSTDEGRSWVQTVAGLGDTVVNDIATTRGTIFAATQNKGIFASTDAGGNWKAVSDGLACPHVYRLLVHGRDLFAGTVNEGVWRRPLSELTGTGEENQGMPAKVRLFQNYPNPFNAATVIRYAIPGARGQGLGASRVRLAVYDLLGREVAVLVNENKAPGNYEVVFSAKGGSASGGNAANFASGMYFYRLQVRSLDSESGAGSFVDVKKLVLVR